MKFIRWGILSVVLYLVSPSHSVTWANLTGFLDKICLAIQKACNYVDGNKFVPVVPHSSTTFVPPVVPSSNFSSKIVPSDHAPNVKTPRLAPTQTVEGQALPRTCRLLTAVSCIPAIYLDTVTTWVDALGGVFEWKLVLDWYMSPVMTASERIAKASTGAVWVWTSVWTAAIRCGGMLTDHRRRTWAICALLALLVSRCHYARHDFLVRLSNVNGIFHADPFDLHNRLLDARRSVDTPSVEVISLPSTVIRGGGTGTTSAVKKSPTLPGSRLLQHPVRLPEGEAIAEDRDYMFAGHATAREVDATLFDSPDMVAVCIPLHELSDILKRPDLLTRASYHGIYRTRGETKKALTDRLRSHRCGFCDEDFTLFRRVGRKFTKGKSKDGTRKIDLEEGTTGSSSAAFPPGAPSARLLEEIVKGFCADISPAKIEERGCAVCGALKATRDLLPLSETDLDLDILAVDGVTRVPRRCSSEPVRGLEGPVLEKKLSDICCDCFTHLEKGKMPPLALANGLWIGDIPPELSGLTFAERMLVARIRHNRCLVRVASGRSKMIANVVMYENPTPFVYDVLPPRRKDLEEHLAFVFMGSVRPQEEEFKRTPMIVNRNRVKNALNWLKVNHRDYADLEISLENLETYEMEGIPVLCEYRYVNTFDNGNMLASELSKHDGENEKGTKEGPCPFTVHSLTGVDVEKIDLNTLKARAMRHLMAGGSALGFGHAETPQSMYDNPQAYPQMFPWLFPYGLGGIGQTHLKKKVSESTHKRHLLLYHDKRFQKDQYFPIVAFNHEQMKSGWTASHLMAKRKDFPNIARRLAKIRPQVINEMATKLKNGAKKASFSEEEKQYYRILEDIDHVGGNVKGSLTGKKWMRNELWSMLAMKGAPLWYITFSPADVKHPICLYYADKDVEFKPRIRLSKERNKLIADNPVAAAKFFDLMVKLVIKHVFGVGQEHDGLYGKTSAYYGTVEQQGRLTLHLHCLLWISKSLSPQEVRDRLMAGDSEFQQKIIEYFESVHQGEFINGSYEEVRTKVPFQSEEEEDSFHKVMQEKTETPAHFSYVDPTQTLPVPPPERCEIHKLPEDGCGECQGTEDWWERFRMETDDLLFRSNIHTCPKVKPRGFKAGQKEQDEEMKTTRPSGRSCLNKDGVCKARFPREIVKETHVDEEGRIIMKHLEASLNTFSLVLTYLLRCNTDVTSLGSGTGIKAVISYVTDYVTKPALKTHQIFSSAYDVFQRLGEEDWNKDNEKSAGRKLILKIVNSLTSKMEIGSPTACMYLLGNPDHYTSHEFVPFWWRSYVLDAMRAWTVSEEEMPAEDDGSEVEDEDDGREDDHLEAHTSEQIDNEMERYRYGGGRAEQGLDGNDELEVSDVEEDADDQQGYSEDNDEEEDDDDGGNDRVFLDKQGEKVVGKTYVDDYKCRPNVYNDLTLIEWIQCSLKRARRKKKNTKEDGAEGDDQARAVEDESGKPEGKKKYMAFKEGHPARNTHEVYCDMSRKANVIPNFIGGSLPRRDLGDREFYCATMLTLMKPWRSGKDLKGEGETWDDAFNAYAWTEEDLKLMNNFNLKYECLDARDNYRTELMRKGKNAGGFFPQELDGWDATIEDDFQDFVQAKGNAGDIMGDMENQDPKGKYSTKIRQMAQAEVILKTCGWIKRVAGATKRVTRLAVDYMKGTVWKQRVKDAKEREELRRRRNMDANPVKKGPSRFRRPATGVHLVGIEYFREDFEAEQERDRELVKVTAENFQLNKEQSRAFNIIANHASLPAVEQLKMYLGGMGGTGKSQVIKALKAFFEARGESHRILILAPTGTAAALLNGYTYHSALGIRFKDADGDRGLTQRKAESAIIRDVCTRLEGVDYIFIDEISMMACHELYAVSARLAQVSERGDEPFGGFNMIFAGDFAQLPPTGGSSLYSNNMAFYQSSSMSLKQQETTLGKILWHQVTTVVILRENMRQKTQSEEDAKLRKALENMRYGACTAEDILFLRTKIVSDKPDRPSLDDPNFHNVSVITAWNSQRDRTNDLGVERFAEETGETVYSFYSTDTYGGDGSEGQSARNKSYGLWEISPKAQEKLWKLHPSLTDHVPGILRLCTGLPVLLRYNDATELCITKGQEARVVGWNSKPGEHGRPVLETVFVELINPPKEVKVDGLPTNVVPIVSTANKVKCVMPRGGTRSFHRKQVNILPNFAMTDYSSQGKTRPWNVVDLGNCRSAQSYYTCLSRSSSAAGTAIIQGFDTKKITQGIHGYLRQEFRELDTLDRVTQLRYENKLPEEIIQPLRNPTLRRFKLWAKENGEDDYESRWHSALRWRKNEKRIAKEARDATWDLTLLKQNTPVAPPKKRARKESVTVSEKEVPATPSKKIRNRASSEREEEGQRPEGIKWDAADHSCGYDSVLTILLNIFREDQVRWGRQLTGTSAALDVFHKALRLVNPPMYTLEMARNVVREYLRSINQAAFPRGTEGVDMDELLAHIWERSRNPVKSSKECMECGRKSVMSRSMVGPSMVMTRASCLRRGLGKEQLTIARGMELFCRYEVSAMCTQCVKETRHRILGVTDVKELPGFMSVTVGSTDVLPSARVVMHDGLTGKEYALRGVIYGGSRHFVSRIIDQRGMVWYHDGIETRSWCTKERKLTDGQDLKWLQVARGRQMVAAIYASYL